MSIPVEDDLARRSARSGAAGSGRRSSCRSPTRRPGRASRRGGSSKLTSSTAFTSPTLRWRMPPRQREEVGQVLDLDQGAVRARRGGRQPARAALARAPVEVVVDPAAHVVARRPSPTGRSSGWMLLAVRDVLRRPGPRSVARSGRPAGRSMRFGTAPGMVVSSSWTCAEGRHRADQAAGVRVLRIGEQRARVGLLDDLAGVHDRHPVAHLGDHPQVVGDEDDGRPGLAPGGRA